MATSDLYPNADVSGLWTPSTGSYCWECVNDKITSGDYMAVAVTNTEIMECTTVTGVTSATSLQIYLYGSDGENDDVSVAYSIADGTPSTFYSVGFGFYPDNAWGSHLFSGLSLTQSDVDALRVHVKNSSIGTGTSYVYCCYIVLTYTGTSINTINTLSYTNVYSINTLTKANIASINTLT